MATIQRLLTVAAISLCASVVQAQTQLFGVTTENQRVITESNPALIGLAWKRSRLECNDANVTDRFITVENYGTGTVTDERFAMVSGLTIDGNEGVPASPYANTDEKNLSTIGATHDSDGIELDGEYPQIIGNRILDWRGIGVTARTYFRCASNQIELCHTGIKAAHPDCRIEGNLVRNCRDYLLWVGVGSGAVRSSFNHYYGARVAGYNEGGSGFQSTNDIYADAAIGYLGADFGFSGNSSFDGCLFQHTDTRCVIIRSPNVTFTGCQFIVQREVATSGTQAGDLQAGLPT